MATAQILRSRSPASSLSALALHAHFQRTAVALHALGEQCPSPISDISAPCGVQPHTESGYTDSPGSTIIKEVYGTLRLEPDGSVFYQGADEAGRRARSTMSPPPRPKAPRCSEAVAGAQRPPSRCFATGGDAELYLSEIDSNKRFTVSFDYAVGGGIPLRLRLPRRHGHDRRPDHHGIFPPTAAAIRSAIRPHCCCPSGRPRPSRTAIFERRAARLLRRYGAGHRRRRLVCRLIFPERTPEHENLAAQKISSSSFAARQRISALLLLSRRARSTTRTSAASSSSAHTKKRRRFDRALLPG